ncbi:CamS family sex pheromone protein [Niallia sp. 01092]|uniref:CamS family sex pheromone protein n=1 Tax=unclassified Niallia TaxID=2837522 RepID=UPI003FD4C461
MKKRFMLIICLVLFLSACAPSFQKEEEVKTKTNDSTTETAILPKYKISDDYYSMKLPFKSSAARGLVVNNLNTRYDISEFETGLMRVAQNTFDPNEYYFQEGQYLTKEVVSSWLNRKFTKQQLGEKDVSASNNIGLNPSDEGLSMAQSGQMEPIYLAHVLEHDYLIKNKKSKTVTLGGVTIGLALNSVYYYQKEKGGAVFKSDISQAKLESEGKKIASEVIKRLRKMQGLGTVPITIALFEQKETSSVVPGNFIAYASAAKGSSSLGDWEKINEQYVLFPNGDSKYKSDEDPFSYFKQDIEEYFPNFNGVIGRAFYVNNKLQNLNIEIPIQLYGKAEVIGFTQFVAGQVMDHFSSDISVQVSITSVNGAESLIVRDADADKPFVHIYE